TLNFWQTGCFLMAWRLCLTACRLSRACASLTYPFAGSPRVSRPDIYSEPGAPAAALLPYKGNFVRGLGPKGGRVLGRNNWPDGGSQACRPNGLRLMASTGPEQTRSPAPTPPRCP